MDPLDARSGEDPANQSYRLAVINMPAAAGGAFDGVIESCCGREREGGMPLVVSSSMLYVRGLRGVRECFATLMSRGVDAVLRKPDAAAQSVACRLSPAR